MNNWILSQDQNHLKIEDSDYDFLDGKTGECCFRCGVDRQCDGSFMCSPLSRSDRRNGYWKLRVIPKSLDVKIKSCKEVEVILSEEEKFLIGIML